jgi:RAB6A-GEF complex partner protein 1
MYWPCGVPQVYAHHGRTPESINGEDVDGDDNRALSDEAHAQAKAELILDVCTTRSDHLLATISATNLNVWSTRPMVVLASYQRSAKSVDSYGQNAGVLFKPDAGIVVVRTDQSYLITFIVESDQNNRVLQQNHGQSQSRRQSMLRNFGTDEGAGLGEVLLRFRRSIKIDAGINTALASDQELTVATVKPAAVQCIRWESQKEVPQAVAQVLSKLEWIGKNSISFMTYDRAMNLAVWVGADGSGYAVQRTRPKAERATSDDSVQSSESTTTTPRLFDGYCFHKASGGTALCATINARFSLIAIALSDNVILCYVAKDYVGNIPLSHSFRSSASPSATGAINSITWSPDGYCLFVAYQNGWATWSVFGKEGASSFECNTLYAESHREDWLLGVKTANWLGNGAEVLLTAGDDRLFKLDMSRSAAIGCFSCANLVRALLQTPTEVTVYRGHELPDLTSISNEASLWHHAQFPASYLNNQWPMRSCVVSQDGRYVAVAGRRGLAHYSVNSGRWKTFSDSTVETSFAVRGGMCWFSHILAAATESAAGYDLRLYSRELDLGRTPLSTEAFSMPIVFVGPSGESSLLVYTYENVLYHYVISMREHRAQLVQVGQIAFHGVVRAPSRVRSVSWVVPDTQLRSGDPSRDVEFASVLFLVDDKLVLLQPSRTQEDDLKYDLRVIAQHVEYYILMRDQIYFNFSGIEESAPSTPSPGAILSTRSQSQYTLRDSLWIFCGDDLRLWPDVRDVLHYATEGDLAADVPLLSVPVDFYPLSILLTKGVVLGIEGELLQRRNVGFAQWRSSIRTQLFLPYIMRRQLLNAHDTAAAFALANQYQHLSYFPHALEILLHHVLDDEHDDNSRTKPKGMADDVSQPQTPLTPTLPPPEPLPSVLSFLQILLSPTTYLSTIVSCIRKTELSYWQTLFDHLPPALTMFEQALELEDLKTASGLLIILQGLEENDGDSDGSNEKRSEFELEKQVVRLMKVAREKGDFELCSELARFMMGVDPRGDALRRVIVSVGFKQKSTHLDPSDRAGLALRVPSPDVKGKKRDKSYSPAESGTETSPSLGVTGKLKSSLASDYFSASPGGY